MSVMNPEQRHAAPEYGWGDAAAEGRGRREVLTGRGARRWFTGAGVAGLVLILSNAHDLAGMATDPGTKVLIAAHVVAFLLAFALGPPLGWGQPLRRKLWFSAGFILLSGPFFIYSSPPYSAAWLWTYVAVFIGVQAYPRALGMALVGVLAAGSAVLQLVTRYPLDIGFSQPITIASLGLMMMAFGRQRAAIAQLRATQHELAELAVAEERNRVARDMHDILGHSLTVIALKAELAGRLLEVDPEKAAVEIAELEDLARGALVDVRATVSGHRGVNVISELAHARTALAAAGIEADLPGAADSVRAKDRELFGWVLREGITNVVRHSSATLCRVTVGARFIQIDDDGVGQAGAAGRVHVGQGNGLRGLAERVSLAGGTLNVGSSPDGGYQIRVTV
jgi:two-component system, NarL family, sensor histidine kinase DesK